MKEDQRICDKCEHFEVSPGGCVETCHMVRMNSTLTFSFQPYADERINGNKTTCKDYIKLRKEA